MSDDRKRHTYLSPPDLHRLNWACLPLIEAFGRPPYLVGSALTRPDYRDIDLRLILDDKIIERMFADCDNPKAAHRLVNIALSDLIAKAANLPAPVDFQIQSRTEANAEPGPRNPMGVQR